MPWLPGVRACSVCEQAFEPKLRGFGPRKRAAYCSAACRRRASRRMPPDCVRTQSGATDGSGTASDPSRIPLDPGGAWDGLSP